MPLEEVIAENTAALRLLITLLQSGGVLPATTGGPAAASESTKPSKPKKNDGRTVSVKLVAGDPDGTRYFHIEKHSTVAAIKPGEVVPDIEGQAEIDGDQYLALKEKYAAKKPDTAATTSTDSSTKPADSADAGVSFKTVVEKLTVLSKDTREGCGRPGVKAILDTYLPTLDEKERKVPKLEALGKNTEILAAIDALLAPEEDDLGLG